MKLPSWIEEVEPAREVRDESGNRSLVVTLRIKWWHPALWIGYLKRRLKSPT